MASPVEVVRDFTARQRKGDIAGCLEMLHPECVFAEAEGLPFPGDYVGPDGFIRLVHDVTRSFRLVLDEPVVTDAGDCVLVRLRGVFTNRATGRSLDMPIVDVYRVRDGRIASVDIYYKDTRAMYDLYAEGVEGSP